MGRKKDRFDVKHSPGPWRMDDDGVTVLNAGGRPIGTVRDFSDEDWNLMLSAATLFQAARRVRKVLAAYEPFDDDTPEGKEIQAASDALFDAMLFAKYGIPVEGDVPDIFD